MGVVSWSGFILLPCSLTFIYSSTQIFAFVLVALYFTFSLLWFNWQNKMIVFSLRYNVKYFIINQPTRRVVQTHLYAIFNPLGVFFFFCHKNKAHHLPFVSDQTVSCVLLVLHKPVVWWAALTTTNLISLETDCFLHPFAANPRQPTSSSAEHWSRTCIVTVLSDFHPEIQAWLSFPQALSKVFIWMCACLCVLRCIFVWNRKTLVCLTSVKVGRQRTKTKQFFVFACFTHYGSEDIV